jgi:hypothetical protein
VEVPAGQFSLLEQTVTVVVEHFDPFGQMVQTKLVDEFE